MVFDCNFVYIMMSKSKWSYLQWFFNKVVLLNKRHPIPWPSWYYHSGRSNLRRWTNHPIWSTPLHQSHHLYLKVARIDLWCWKSLTLADFHHTGYTRHDNQSWYCHTHVADKSNHHDPKIKVDSKSRPFLKKFSKFSKHFNKPLIYSTKLKKRTIC